MKKLILLILTCFIACSFISAQNAEKSRHLKPSNFTKKVTTVISGEERSYYSLSNEQPSVISVQGPGTLRVLTRGRFQTAQEDYISYEILYTIDGGEQKRVRMKDVVRSKQATYLNGSLGMPGDREDFDIELVRGDHTIEFLLKDGTVPVAVQYLFTPGKEKQQDWIDFSPLQPSEPVDLVSSETSVTYYRFSGAKPLRIEVNGPTELRVFTRVEYQYQMQGRVDYRLQLSENGKVMNTYQMSSTRSEVTIYKNDKNLIPGKASEFLVEVPSGKHVYQVVPLDPDKGTLLARIMFPKNDVKLSK